MLQSTKLRMDWIEAYRSLRMDIDQGRLAPGSVLPTIAELANSAGLTAYGARRVLERLRQDGRAQSWQGKGYRVAIPLIRLQIFEKRPTFGEHVRALGFDTSSNLISARTVRPPHEIAQRMGASHNNRVERTEVLRKANGKAVALSVDYFARDRLEGINRTLAQTGSVSASLAQHGVSSYKRDRTILSARLPTAHEALLLDIPRSQQVFATLGANLDADGTVLQVSKGIWRADCVTYEF